MFSLTDYFICCHAAFLVCFKCFGRGSSALIQGDIYFQSFSSQGQIRSSLYMSAAEKTECSSLRAGPPRWKVRPSYQKFNFSFPPSIALGLNYSLKPSHLPTAGESKAAQVQLEFEIYHSINQSPLSWAESPSAMPKMSKQGFYI